MRETPPSSGPSPPCDDRARRQPTLNQEAIVTRALMGPCLIGVLLRL